MPVALLKVLSEYFAKFNYIHKAFLLWMVRDNECSYLLVIDAERRAEALFENISNISHDYLDGYFLDIIMADTSFGKSIIENETPFYRA